MDRHEFWLRLVGVCAAWWGGVSARILAPLQVRSSRPADFNVDAVPGIQPAQLAALAKGGYMDTGEPIVPLGDSGTGKLHLLIGLGLAACEQGRRVRYVTTAQLANELVEAADDRVLSRVVARYGRLDLLLLDEVGYGAGGSQRSRIVVPGHQRAGGTRFHWVGHKPAVQ